jgi:hypothetical protein
MVRAFKLYTGAGNASHGLEGTIDEKDRTDGFVRCCRRQTANEAASTDCKECED